MGPLGPKPPDDVFATGSQTLPPSSSSRAAVASNRSGTAMGCGAPDDPSHAQAGRSLGLSARLWRLQSILSKAAARIRTSRRLAVRMIGTAGGICPCGRGRSSPDGVATACPVSWRVPVVLWVRRGKRCKSRRSLGARIERTHEARSEAGTRCGGRSGRARQERARGRGASGRSTGAASIERSPDGPAGRLRCALNAERPLLTGKARRDGAPGGAPELSHWFDASAGVSLWIIPSSTAA